MSDAEKNVSLSFDIPWQRDWTDDADERRWGFACILSITGLPFPSFCRPSTTYYRIFWSGIADALKYSNQVPANIRKCYADYTFICYKMITCYNHEQSGTFRALFSVKRSTGLEFFKVPGSDNFFIWPIECQFFQYLWSILFEAFYICYFHHWASC